MALIVSDDPHPLMRGVDLFSRLALACKLQGMAIRKEFNLRLQNSPGALGKVCQYLADEKVGIQAFSLDSGGTLRMVVDNPLNAVGLLREKQYVLAERDVLLLQLPNEAGALYKATRLLDSAGVNVEHAYACSVEAQPMTSVVVAVDDIERASMVAGV
jgi:hypothetical protein